MELNDTLKFLSELNSNNTKEWFDANRKTYQARRSDFLELVDNIINDIAQFDESLAGVESKNCAFRINRDIRFSNDKTPYKTNFGALMGNMGKKSEGTGYYIHIKPQNSFVGGGIYMPAAEKLAAIRQEIDYNPEGLKQLIESEDFKSTFVDIKGDTLKTAPKGYPKDHPNIELLRFKSFYVIKNYSDKELVSGGFYKDAIETYKKAKKFNDYLNHALS
ncbi:DUF2461 domain-containing protein [Reichenbachiella sp. MALMAid0571]|uniref:DUF2461 domain-containing protein n=1 Tax=Reichenbachiella sp. MALMAid0571 TaxID=3143939 RepID=UPI0032E00C54